MTQCLLDMNIRTINRLAVGFCLLFVCRIAQAQWLQRIEINPSSASYPSVYTEFKNKLYFIANDGYAGTELLCAIRIQCLFRITDLNILMRRLIQLATSLWSLIRQHLLQCASRSKGRCTYLNYKGIEQLIHFNIPLVVLTDYSLEYPTEIMQCLHGLGCRGIGFNIE